MTLDTINNGESGLSARTKINAVIGAVNATVKIATPGIAYVESTGNDGTGAVGDPTLPFANLQAAYDAGARVFDIGVGTFAGLTATTLNITLLGKGATQTYVGGIYGQSGNVRGNGKDNITLSGIYVTGASGTNGADGVFAWGLPGEFGSAATAGGQGSNCDDVMVSGLTVSADILIAGGVGGNGGYGGDVTPDFIPGGIPAGNGGSGGLAGATGTLTVMDCLVNGWAAAMGGNSGNGGNGGTDHTEANHGGNGGDTPVGGNGGNVVLIRSKVAGFYAGAGSSGTPGSAGAGGGDPAAAGTPGGTGTPGNIHMEFSKSDNGQTAGESVSFLASLITGYFYSE